jgi:uncharacterized protein (TIGR02118 family)
LPNDRLIGKMSPMTVVRVGMAPRAAGLTPEQCQAHWRSAHADAARSLPGLRAYVQNHAILRDGRPLLPYPGFDVCAETEFDDLAAMDAAFASEQYRGAIVADEQRLIDKTRFAQALCERRVLAEGDGALKLMTFLRRHPAAGEQAFLAALSGHEQLIVRHDLHAGRPPAPFDAVEVLWFADAEAAVAHTAGAAAQDAAYHRAGVLFGAERVVARPNRVI